MENNLSTSSEKARINYFNDYRPDHQLENFNNFNRNNDPIIEKSDSFNDNHDDFISNFDKFKNGDEPMEKSDSLSIEMVDKRIKLCQCCRVYSTSRRKASKEAMKQQGFEKISIDEVQKMQWEALEGHMATWIKVVKYSAKVILPGETKLACSIFSRLSFNREEMSTNPLRRGIQSQPAGFIPLTRYTMNYLRYARDFKDAARSSILSRPSQIRAIKGILVSYGARVVNDGGSVGLRVFHIASDDSAIDHSGEFATISPIEDKRRST
ncbi:hypothetical protein Nepgr_020955 [Nepenthes gracilis]|uniref:Uncharacterized protein n=1 Tax=Nepenthes gracilis TaxID=150966 RepID=A0AAD3SYQ2_NEPGR|nr:hypothetical protein Nepgr_020955 [Nepenthes gracilis]